jgi:uncharacterized protein with NRDE domain
MSQNRSAVEVLRFAVVHSRSMCLIVVAHRVTEELPLVLAANREEDHDRPTIPADFWPDQPDILGGRDALLGGSWLALTRDGRFAAVTNLRGAVRGPGGPSRGDLVRDFVRGTARPAEYADDIATRVDEYAGFHLLVGEIGGTLAQISGAARELEPGIHGLSNAPMGVRWPKVELAETAMQRALTEGLTADGLLRFLSTKPDIFITGDRYGTRSSTVIIAKASEVHFVEQNFARGGAPQGAPRAFRFPLTRSLSR